MRPGQRFSYIDSLGGVVIGGSGTITSEEISVVDFWLASSCTEYLEYTANALRMFDLEPWVCPIVIDMPIKKIHSTTKTTLLLISRQLVLELLLAPVLASIFIMLMFMYFVL